MVYGENVSRAGRTAPWGGTLWFVPDQADITGRGTVSVDLSAVFAAGGSLLERNYGWGNFTGSTGWTQCRSASSSALKPRQSTVPDRRTSRSIFRPTAWAVGAKLYSTPRAEAHHQDRRGAPDREVVARGEAAGEGSGRQLAPDGAHVQGVRAVTVDRAPRSAGSPGPLPTPWPPPLEPKRAQAPASPAPAPGEPSAGLTEATFDEAAPVLMAGHWRLAARGEGGHRAHVHGALGGNNEDEHETVSEHEPPAARPRPTSAQPTTASHRLRRNAARRRWRSAPVLDVLRNTPSLRHRPSIQPARRDPTGGQADDQAQSARRGGSRSSAGGCRSCTPWPPRSTARGSNDRFPGERGQVEMGNRPGAGP